MITVALLVLMTVGCTILEPDPPANMLMTDLDFEPRPGVDNMPAEPATGRVVEVLRGQVMDDEFRVVAYQSARGPCLSTASPVGGGSGCGALPGDGASFGLGATSTDRVSGFTEISGLLAQDVDAIWVESVDGRRFDAVVVDLEPAGIEAKAFITFLPPGAEPVSAIAVDSTGDVLGEQEYSRAPAGDDAGRISTPASPSGSRYSGLPFFAFAPAGPSRVVNLPPGAREASRPRIKKAAVSRMSVD